MTADWRYFKIRALNELGPYASAKEFYAPDLKSAFVLARVEWPRADGWECLGGRK